MDKEAMMAHVDVGKVTVTPSLLMHSAPEFKFSASVVQGSPLATQLDRELRKEGQLNDDPRVVARLLECASSGWPIAVDHHSVEVHQQGITPPAGFRPMDGGPAKFLRVDLADGEDPVIVRVISYKWVSRPPKKPKFGRKA